MPCYYPRQGWRAKKVNESGKRSIVFNPRYAFMDMPITVPCGQCIGCRLEKSRQWAIRITHEASLYDNNCFLTLTYDNEHLPKDGNLVKQHFTKFMKRLRKNYGKKNPYYRCSDPLRWKEWNDNVNNKIRYFMCGEYGEQLGRPHYHAIIFNFDFDDKELLHVKQGIPLYTSEKLSRLWTDENTGKNRGFCTIGQVTFESAGYVARYCTKKVSGAAKEDHYKSVDAISGEIIQKEPEYAQMSKKPSIGKAWFDQYYLDIYRHDVMSVRCRDMRPPKYYDKEFEKIDPKRMAYLKKQRLDNAIDNPENEYQRLLTKCELQHLKARKLHRSYEND